MSTAVKIPNMEKPAGTSEKFICNYFGDQSREVYVTDQEFTWGNKSIVSTTDLKGYIIKANETFIEASGWTEEDLMEQHHSILRHPHMPRSTFVGMWESLRIKGSWHGYVKNLRKDGGYYWVHALVHSTKRDCEVVVYQSARHKLKMPIKKSTKNSMLIFAKKKNNYLTQDGFKYPLTLLITNLANCYASR